MKPGLHFFVHIPKTAGTSFRLAAEREFCRERVVYDYGPQSPVTSDCIQRHLYGEGEEDKSALYAHCFRQGVKLIAGHRPATRFLEGVGVANIITFVREPLARVFSQYLHFKRHHGFEGTFHEFFSEPARQNAQAKMLRGISPRALGFVGITEHYRQSLCMINDLYGWRLRRRHANRSGFLAPGPNGVPKEERALFYEANTDDVALYREARWLFEIRHALAAQSQPFAHVGLDATEGGRILGWAWWAEPIDEPVRVEICINDVPAITVTADGAHKRWGRKGAPHEGRVAFAADVEIRPGDRITGRIAQTGQPLGAEAVIAA